MSRIQSWRRAWDPELLAQEENMHMLIGEQSVRIADRMTRTERAACISPERFDELITTIREHFTASPASVRSTMLVAEDRYLKPDGMDWIGKLLDACENAYKHLPVPVREVYDRCLQDIDSEATRLAEVSILGACHE
jgi:hypothetical protein